MTPKQEAELREDFALGGIEHALQLIRETQYQTLMDFVIYQGSDAEVLGEYMNAVTRRP
jgi:hypothetical protein